MNILTKNIPNTLTCLNILSGCIAIVFAFSPAEIFGPLEGWIWACIAIGCASIFDFFDGFTARALRAYSELGKQLDSLSDLVSFGVAPAMILLNMLRLAPEAPAWLPWIALAIPIVGSIRLANFNIDSRQTSEFIGLPIPANAIFWIGYAVLLKAGCNWLALPEVALPLILAEALLMVAPIRMFSLKFKNYKWSGNAFRWIFLICALTLIITLGATALLPIIVLYILLSIVKNIETAMKK